MNATDTAVYGNSWFAAQADVGAERASLTHDADVDVCVIGGGLAGLTVAREVARSGWSVAVLEAKRIGWNASGRNCGFVAPGFAEDIRQIVERLGLDHARELWTLSEDGVEYVRATIRDADMPGVDPVDGWLNVSKSDDADAFVWLVTLLGQELGADIEGWPADRVRGVLDSPHYRHAIHFPKAFHINPLAYVLGLAATTEQAGVRIFENTPALQIDPAGVRKRIVTPQARLRAGHVVLAGNTHLGGLMPEISETLIPVSSFAAVSRPLGDRLSGVIRYTGAVTEARWTDYHYRIVDGDRLMWGGGLATWRDNPHAWTREFSQAIAATFPQLGDIGFDYAWSGTIGAPLHNMPQLGEVSPGLWLASGFGGHGLNTTAMAGVLLARAIHDNDDAWRLFSPFNLVWAGGVLGRSVMQGAYWASRVKDSVEARLKPRRAELHRRFKERRAAERVKLDTRVEPAAVHPAEPEPIQTQATADAMPVHAEEASAPRRE